jgi:hypothetical protein
MPKPQDGGRILCKFADLVNVSGRVDYYLSEQIISVLAMVFCPTIGGRLGSKKKCSCPIGSRRMLIAS